MRVRQAGGRRGEALKRGRRKLQLDEAKIAEAKRKAEKREEEIGRLRQLRAESLRALDRLGVGDLLDQIRVFKYVDGVDVTLSEFSSKLMRRRHRTDHHWNPVELEADLLALTSMRKL